MSDFKIVVYTKDNCPECVLVKNYLNTYNYEFTEIKISDDNIEYLSNYTRSAPAVFVNDVFVQNTTLKNYIKNLTERPDLTDMEF